jgi:hypothetical protein
MFLDPFAGPRLLVDRCRSHIAVLQDYLKEVGARLELTFTHTEGRFLQYRARLSEQVEADKYLVFREAVNSLAVCLDIALCDAARIADKPIEKVKFPFAKTEKGFNGIVRDIGLGPAFEEWLTRVHPGYGQNVWIAHLHDLDVLTKHRIVVPLLAAAAIRPGTAAPPHVERGFAAIFGSTPVLLHDGAPVGTDLKGEQDPTGIFKLTGEVRMLLPDGVPFEGNDVVLLLEQLAASMLDYIASVEGLAEEMRP